MSTYKAHLESSEFDLIYKHSLNVGDIGICKWNIDKDEMYISEKITGYEFSNLKNMFQYLELVVYPNDRDMAIQDLEDYLSGYRSFYPSTFRVRTKTGEIKWVLIRGKILEDEDIEDKILHVLMLDVTGRKLHEGHDTLTNLINDKFFLRKLKNAISIAETQNKQGALIYLDIDNFISINNNYGFQFGNLVIQKFSHLLSSILDDNCELAKFPGDKFMIMVYDFQDIKEIEEICNRIYDYFKKPLEVMDNQIQINLSIGVTVFPKDSSDENELLKFCDFAVSISKRTGKNVYTIFNKDVSESYFRKALIESEISNAIQKNEFYLLYQPKVDISTNQITSLEALIRWKNNKLGFVSPGEFIPIAEAKGYIVQIGNWVLEEAIKTASKWKEKDYRFETISINISPIQLKRKDFIPTLLSLCEKYSIPHSLLEIEITEGTLIEACKENIGIINDLIESGFKIAIDDFGIGFSNLISLIEFPISTLKIDKSIIDNIKCEKNKVVFKSIVTLGKDLNFKIVAEGVETKEQLEILTKLGCNGIQGYYFYKPLAEEDIEKLLEEKKLMDSNEK